jgi:dipeptidyl aminopeptidase/acylaminoacyl peptidase
LVKWKTFDGREAEGLLYKPENYDQNKKYPMMVYYYRLSSDNLNRYISPKPSRSVINATFYASNGYLVFIPNVRYEIGHPGRSAVNYIVSGTQALIDKGIAHKGLIGTQGQSWGGYQVAYIITQSNIFAAASAGAPVSNMISAYGGIRWKSGMSRMFQYEKTQSRLGATLWENPKLYLENSPIFYLNKVETPLLIRHDDADGAVPWYQGIEMFMGLRRLQKPVWMLNYNGEPHNLKAKTPDNKDLSIRMMQFFDHYLKGKPMPVWMKSGIPAMEKGKTLGYELAE